VLARSMDFWTIFAAEPSGECVPGYSAPQSTPAVLTPP
jgi:hypothetical protein